MYRVYYRVNKLNCSFLTRIRVGRSYLNAHRYSIGQSDTPYCTCNNSKTEHSFHYITLCELYSDARLTLLSNVEQFIPSIKYLSKKWQYKILAQGYEKDNFDLNSINTKILIAFKKFIHQSKRFFKNITPIPPTPPIPIAY